jgi:hypothetical protein
MGYHKIKEKENIRREEENKMLTHSEHIGRGKAIAAVLLGPIAGLVYFICLPIISIGTIVTLLGRKVLAGMMNLTRNLVSFGWRPTEAYLEGKRKKKREKH